MRTAKVAWPVGEAEVSRGKSSSIFGEKKTAVKEMKFRPP